MYEDKFSTKFYTYVHCKPNGDPFYIGKGTVRNKKGVQRCFDFKNNRNSHYRNTITKYGEKSILVYIFPCESEQQAFVDEIQQIHQLRNEKYIISNKTNGGEGKSGCLHNEETKKKIAMKMIGNKYAFGYIASTELRSIRSKNMLGNKNTLGFKHSESSKEKMNKERRKKILHVSNNGILVNKIYESIGDASKELMCDAGAISRVCMKLYKHTKGNIFCYL